MTSQMNKYAVLDMFMTWFLKYWKLKTKTYELINSDFVKGRHTIQRQIMQLLKLVMTYIYIYIHVYICICIVLLWKDIQNTSLSRNEVIKWFSKNDPILAK